MSKEVVSSRYTSAVYKATDHPFAAVHISATGIGDVYDAYSAMSR